MKLNFDDFLGALEDENIWDEKPVDLQTFLYSKDFMALPQLSDVQEEIVELGSNILKRETWIELYGVERGNEIADRNRKELFFLLGKGCSAPYTPVYDASTGRWKKLDEFTALDNKVVGVHDGENKLLEQYATESFLEGCGEMVRVTTQLGWVEDVYVGHKYYAMRKKEFYKRNSSGAKGSAIKIEDLQKGDRVALSLGLPITDSIDQPLEEITLVAYWIGDGCMPHGEKWTAGKWNSINVDFGEQEVDSLKRYTEALDSLAASYTIKKHPKKKMFTVQSHGLGSNNKALGNLLTKYDLWGVRAGNKKIPELIWRLPNDKLAHFVSCLWSTDGCVYLKKNVPGKPLGASAEYTTISSELGHGLHKVLLRLGVPSSIRSRIPTYTYRGEKKKGQKAFYITVSSADSFDRFAREIGGGLMDQKKEKLLAGLELTKEVGKGYNRTEGELYWDQIKSIEPLGENEYWTLTVPETHNYVGNGIISFQSGKDFMSEVICARIAYLLLCLKDPAAYYGKPSGDSIDIVNVAKNAKQANNVFFAGLKTRIKFCKWFNGRYKARAGDIEFDKNVRIHSLNSENEGTEGLNIMVAVLDELDSFDEGDTTENADKMYKTLRATVSSRFDEVGKLLVLSFPRRKDGFIMRKYNEFVVEKIVRKNRHTFVLNPQLPPGSDGNEFSVEWEEDEIISYRYAQVWALRRPTWRVNPTKTIDSFTMDFYADLNDSLGRFAACPQDTDGINDWYKDKAKIDATFTNPNGVTEDGSIRIEPNPAKEYYVHVDLALVQDNAALALAHVEDFKQFQIAGTILDPAPHIVVDLVRYWKPGKDRPLDFTDIREFIISLRRKGFNIRMVTFDRWNSAQIIKSLNEIGIPAEKLSVARDHYNEFALTMGENRLVGPDSELLKKELKTIIINEKGKVDHPGRTGNDLADATCGAIFNAASLTAKPDGSTEIVTYADIKRDRQEERRKQFDGTNVIHAPKVNMPKEIQNFLDGIRFL